MKYLKLGEVCEILNGYAFKSSKYTNEGYRVIRITNVQKGIIIDESPQYYSNKEMNDLKKYELFENDILISLTGNVGRVGIMKKTLLPAALNQRVACLRLKERNVYYKYLFYFLNTDRFENMCIENSNGIAQKNLSTLFLKDVLIPIPPLETQKKIVEVLDKAQGLIDARKEQIRLMDELIQSVFYEMFGDLDKNNKGFPIVKLGEVCLKVTDGKHGGCEREENSGFYYVGAREIFDYEIHYDSAPQITFKDFAKDYRRCNLENGDLVIVNTGATIGKTAIANNVLTEKTLLQKSVALLKTDKEKISAKFLQYIYICNERLYKVKSASAQPNLLLSQIRETGIYLPSLDQQYVFVQFTEHVEELKAQVQKSLDEIMVLLDSLMQKNFQ